MTRDELARIMSGFVGRQLSPVAVHYWIRTPELRLSTERLAQLVFVLGCVHDVIRRENQAGRGDEWTQTQEEVLKNICTRLSDVEGVKEGLDTLQKFLQTPAGKRIWNRVANTLAPILRKKLLGGTPIKSTALRDYTAGEIHEKTARPTATT
jgi:hypothetical protein